MNSASEYVEGKKSILYQQYQEIITVGTVEKSTPYKLWRSDYVDIAHIYVLYLQISFMI